MTSPPYRAVTRLRIVIAMAMAVTALSLAPAAGTAFAQSALYPGAVGLVANTGGVPATPIATADLNLRAGPSFGDSVLMVIPAGAALAPTGEWSQGFVGVTYEGNYGWVDSGLLAAGEPGVDTAPQPAAATKDVALLQEVAPAPVTTAEPAPTKDAALVSDLSAVPGETAYATDVVNLRAGSSESSEVLRVLPRGGRVTITGEPSNGWTPVWYNGTTGYISTNLLSAFTTTPQTSAAPVSLAQETAPVAAASSAADPAVTSGSGELAATTLNHVNLRGGPAYTAPVMGTIPAGATLTALAGPEQGFYQVQYGDQIGWASAEFLQVSATYLQRDNQSDTSRQEGKVEGSAPAANAELGAGGIIWPVSGG